MQKPNIVAKLAKEDGFKQVLRCPVKRSQLNKGAKFESVPTERSKKLPIKFLAGSSAGRITTALCVDGL